MSILSQADIESLRVSGLVSPPYPDGTRRIHKRRAGQWSDEEYADLPLNDVSTTPDTYLTIPEELVSLATLKYLGWDDETAAILWNEWTSRPPDDSAWGLDDIDGMGFLGFVTDRSTSNGLNDTCDDDDWVWYHYMSHCGINAETQESIMDPCFKEIRLTESCRFWVQDTVDSRYRALLEIRSASQARAMALQQAPKTSDGATQT
ncbi:hypothetical protein GGS26DRAFT_560110 [Hypomontagnella submonticulosa]|nr:hypothetical protein GGS26DRAFT_560110 [Hypomontagnella submonticulosa]